MNKNEMMGFVKENLENALSKIEKVEGLRDVNYIVNHLEGNVLGLNVTILRNNHFELEYDINSKEVEFKTTYSNQLITNEYMNEMLLINQHKDWVCENIKTLDKMLNE